MFRFQVDELLHGALEKDVEVRAFGYEGERRSNGSCWRFGYSIGSRYVLIVDKRGLPYEYPLTPVNELASERWVGEPAT